MPKLTYRQVQSLTEHANYPEGGFTAKAEGSRAGQAPRNKFLVGTKAQEKVLPHPVHSEQLMGYVEEHAKTLSRQGRSFGGWQEGKSVYLDAPREFPTTGKGETRARRSTLREDQQAYGQTGPKGEYAGSTTSPFHPETELGKKFPEFATPGARRQAEVQAWVNRPAEREKAR